MEGNGNCVQAEAVAYRMGKGKREKKGSLALDWVAQRWCTRHKGAVRWELGSKEDEPSQIISGHFSWRIIQNPRKYEISLCPVSAVVACASA